MGQRVEVRGGLVVIGGESARPARTANRTCGECVACCSYLRIDEQELQKPGLTHCPHVRLRDPVVENHLQYTGSSQKNCSAYGTDDRPGCCAGYHCAWVAGHGREEDRPDRSMMIFDREGQIENALEAKPLDDGIQDTQAARSLIDRMSRSTGMPVIVLSFYERRILRITGSGV